MWKLAFANLAVILGFLFGIEACSWSVLALKGQPQPFLIDPTMGFGHTLQVVNQSKTLRHIDPLLGWGYDMKQVQGVAHLKNQYALYGSKDSRAFRIVITGGSTTDSFGSRRMWPVLLTRKLRAEGYCIRSYVGAVAGYNTNQEMLKIVRDQYEVQPQLHISYSGVNEHETKYSLPSFYSLELAHKLVSYRRLFMLPNTAWLLTHTLSPMDNPVTGVNEGLDQPHDRADRWNYNLRRMHALAKEFDYEFIGILQPILGVGEYTPTAIEQKRITDMNLTEEWGPFYEKARRHVKAAPYLYDFVDIFSGKSGVFTDDCHVTMVGERTIADNMYRLLMTRYSHLLDKAKIGDCL